MCRLLPPEESYSLTPFPPFPLALMTEAYVQISSMSQAHWNPVHKTLERFPLDWLGKVNNLEKNTLSPLKIGLKTLKYGTELDLFAVTETDTLN